MHASLNVGYQGKSGPGKIHEVILVSKKNTRPLSMRSSSWNATMQLPVIIKAQKVLFEVMQENLIYRVFVFHINYDFQQLVFCGFFWATCET